MTPVFELYIDDDRYAVPSLYLITAITDAEARAEALEVWENSDHHLGVELRRDGVRVYALGSMAHPAFTSGGRSESPAA
jgi:hypothetical protein